MTLVKHWYNQVNYANSHYFESFHCFTCGLLTTSMNRTSMLRVTISGSAIFSVAQRAGSNPRLASWTQNSLFLWAIFAKTLKI